MRALTFPAGRACEIHRKLAAFLLALALTLAPAAAAAQDHGAPAPAEDHAAQGEAHGAAPGEAHGTAGDHAAAEDHGESPWALVGKILNFAILAGTVIYFARKPLAGYLAQRRAQVRDDLVTAEQTTKTAEAQLQEIERKLQQLPGELDALRARGQQEIAAEEERIRVQADAERARLLEQARREIDQQLRIARRQLIEHAAALSVEVADARIRREITDQDRLRLVDRYLTQVKGNE